MSKPYTAKIVMTGPTGVGKTSLLAAMYPLLEKHFPSGDYQLVPEENTRKVLDNLRQRLENLGTGGIKILDKQITGTLRQQEFNFDLRFKGGADVKPATDLSLQVWDIPGAYCTADKGRQAQGYLDDSDISFWCVDSVALMERNGVLNAGINAPNEMTDCIFNSKLKNGHTVCIVLMRSETYEQDGACDKLFDVFRKTYAASAIRLKNAPRIGNVFYCAVQTTGNLRFNIYEGASPVFIRARHLEGYNPKFCELPVLVAVRHSLDNAITDAVQECNRIRKDYFPFTRWLPFLPGHAEYKQKKGVAERLPIRLRQVLMTIQKRIEDDEKNRRLFKW